MTHFSKDAGDGRQVPLEIETYLVGIALQDHAPAYLQVTETGHLVNSGGNLKKYELDAIAPGDYIGETFYYLEGFFPLMHTEVIQHLQLDCGPVVDVHIVSTAAGDGAGWVLLLDTTAEAQRVQKLQQKGNDLSLLRQQYARLLNQNLTPSQQASVMVGEVVGEAVGGASEETAEEAAEETADGVVAPQTISVLIIKFCGSGADQLSIGTPSTLKAVNASLSFITQVIVEEGGLINHVLGGTAAAFFGLLPSQQAASQQALYAAKRVLSRLMDQPPNYALSPLSEAASAEPACHRALGVGASITSGKAAAGILNGQGGHRLNAVGDPIQSAAQLGRYIQPGTITIDRNTFEAVEHYQDNFQAFQSVAESFREVKSEIMLYRLKFE